MCVIESSVMQANSLYPNIYLSLNSTFKTYSINLNTNMLGRKSNARRSNARHSGVRHSTINRPSIMSATIPFNAYSDNLDSIDEVDNTKNQEENASNTALTNWENLRKAVPTVIDVESILKTTCSSFNNRKLW